MQNFEEKLTDNQAIEKRKTGHYENIRFYLLVTEGKANQN